MRSKGEKDHWIRISEEMDRRLGEFKTYAQRLSDLRTMPPGYRRCFAMYFSDADIDNGGFDRFFYNRFGCLALPAMEGYERIGGRNIVKVMKSAVFVCLRKHPDLAEGNDFALPSGYFDGFEPVADTLKRLDELYYRESDLVPGADRVRSSYPIGAIEHYIETFPEDFK